MSDARYNTGGNSLEARRARMTPERLAKFLAGCVYLSEQARFRRLTAGIGTRGCWTFLGKVNNWGYGQFALEQKAGGPVRLVLAHRYAYELEGNMIPAGMVIDHTCRNPRCVRADHLRAVTKRVSSTENTDGIFAVNLRKVNCKHGHPLSGDNIVYIKQAGRKTRHGNPAKTGYTRVCLTCWPWYINSSARVTKQEYDTRGGAVNEEER